MSKKHWVQKRSQKKKKNYGQGLTAREIYEKKEGQEGKKNPHLSQKTWSASNDTRNVT